MQTIRKYALFVALGLVLGGVAVEYGPLLLRLLPSWGTPTDAMIVYESGFDKPLTQNMVTVLAKATDFNVKVIDQHTLGKNKKPSAYLSPFLDAAKGHDLPVLVLRWAGGSYSVQPCPTTLAELKAEVQ